MQDEGESIWPENWQAVQVFVTLSTQWRLAPSGHLLGLDYAAIPPVLSMSGVPRAQWPELFGCLRTMEGAALDALKP